MEMEQARRVQAPGQEEVEAWAEDGWEAIVPAQGREEIVSALPVALRFPIRLALPAPRWIARSAG